jgi:tetratricopeptide (TPR) repeat protein
MSHCDVQALAAPNAGKKDLAVGRKLTKAQRYPEAATAFTRAIQANFRLAAAWSGRGYALMHAGDIKGARRDVTYALEHTQTDSARGAIWYNLALLEEKAGGKTAALEAINKSLRYRPQNKAARPKQKSLDRPRLRKE